jgi:DNA-binding GntR family transcriptional regulator
MSSDPAYAKLREAIVAGEFQPNERLVEADLSKDFGLARAAIRTALVLLEQEGLVAREPNRGARVRLISAEEAVEILEAREALEGVAARHAAVNAIPSDIEDLRAIIAGMRTLLERGDLLGMSDESHVLHARMLEIAQHRTITRLISNLKSQTVRFQYRTILVPGRPQQAFDEHSAIVEAIAAKDPDLAEATMRRHLSQIREALGHHRDGGTRGIDMASVGERRGGDGS